MTTVEMIPVDRHDWLLPLTDDGKARETCLTLDCRTGVFTAQVRYGQESWGWSEEVVRHLELWIPIPTLTAAAANDLLRANIPLAQQILDGYSEHPDDNQFPVGRLTTTAAAAAAELAEVCDPAADWPESSQVSTITAAEWQVWRTHADEVAQDLGIHADMTDHDLATIAAQQAEQATESTETGYLVLVGMEELLHATRATLREEAEERAEDRATMIAYLRGQQELDMRRLATWGRTDRAIAKTVGVSHPTVADRVDRDATTCALARIAAAGSVWRATGVGDELVLVEGQPALDGQGPVLLPGGAGEVVIWMRRGLPAALPRRRRPRRPLPSGDQPTAGVKTGILVRNPKVIESGSVPD